MHKPPHHLPARSSNTDIATFLKKTASMPTRAQRTGISAHAKRGRLIFGMDATASREASWHQACQIQGQMFMETETLGGLEIQLAWYRGLGEFYASAWHADSANLLREMSGASCAGGRTQIHRLLRHIIKEHARRAVHAAVFVGDCLEENIDALAHEAAQLGLLGVPLFIFHEGREPQAARGFAELARLTHGAYCTFDAASAAQLRDLLSAVAVYAAGGQRALLALGKHKNTEALRLTQQLRST